MGNIWSDTASPMPLGTFYPAAQLNVLNKQIEDKPEDKPIRKSRDQKRN
jgi:hypothetical protein